MYLRIPQTNLRVAVKLLRDASWITNSNNREPEIRNAFALVLDTLKPAVFWDVGANIGFYSWFVLRHSAVREVVMFEPDPTNFSLINRTIRRNSLCACKAINAALADRTGEASFLLDRASGATGSLEATSRPEDRQSLHHAYQMSDTITCRTETIDGLIAGGASPPHLIKIDVEGAEHLVLAGAKSCLGLHRPIMIIETSNTDLVRQLRESGYTAFRVDPENLLFIAAREGQDLTAINRVFPAI